MDQDYSTLNTAEGYSVTDITDVNPEVTQITETTVGITDIYSHVTEVISEFFNFTDVTDDYNFLNATGTDTDESVSCEYQPWGVLSLTIEDFDENWSPIYLSNSLYNLIPAGLVLTLLIIGIPGNLINILIYTRPVMRTPISKLLAVLELVNLFLFFTFIPGLIRHYNPEWQITFSHVIFEIIDLVGEGAVVCCSNWLTVMVGIWRYVAINWPLSVDRFCGWLRTKIAILVIAIISILISIPPAFLSTYDQMEFNITYNSNTSEEYSKLLYVYALRDTEIACLNPNLEKFSDGLVLLTTVIPCICLAIVTCFLLRSLWAANFKRRGMSSRGTKIPPGLTPQVSIPYNRNESSKEKRVTILLTLLVFLYFLAYLPDAVINIYQLSPEGTDNLVKTTFYNVAKTRLTVLICNCATFFIYFMMSERYRETLKKVLLPSEFAKNLSKKSSSLQQSVCTMTVSKAVSLKDVSVTTNV